MESSEYKTSNPFAPYWTEEDIGWIGEELREMMDRSRYGVLVIVMNDGRVDSIRKTEYKKRPKFMGNI